MKNFSYPEQNKSGALAMPIKTRKTANGGFEACGALFFGGKRLRQEYAQATTRAGAIKAVTRILETGRGA